MTILRTWDLSYEYGPCVGMTRMERWQRASKLGLDPPEIVCSWLLDLTNLTDPPCLTPL